MVWQRTAVHSLAICTAVGALSLFATGCDSGSAVETNARASAETDNGAVVPSVGDDASDARSANDQTDAVAPSAQPIVATKPEGSRSDVALASAKIVADDSAAKAASDATPRVIDASLDASKYPGGIIPASPNAQPLPGGPRLLVPEKTFRSVGHPPALQVSYDDLDLLKVLNVDPVPTDVVDQFPSWLRDLDGKRVRIRGFMYPAYEEMLSAFVLTRDTGACCFGPNPKVYYLIGVKLKEGTKVRYVQNRPVDVVGTFHIQPVVSDGNWFGLYKISDASVVE